MKFSFVQVREWFQFYTFGNFLMLSLDFLINYKFLLIDLSFFVYRPEDNPRMYKLDLYHPKMFISLVLRSLLLNKISISK